ncbi:NmrA domain-containing protein [Fusarium falciforme]|uniref:NmrA domain-containing protein n=1 Tax=Fusarium falciforme TaxID=195108 RepID=UPI002300DFEF|nr:NmrA domain-containing protein [Fusarium falciforme]WAO84840.1 NmrA domain-containing protein [Fusarium falciforme]
MKVAIVGATGQTGSVIAKALLESTTPKFEVTALTRPSSLQKPQVLELAEKGVNIVAADLTGSEEELKKALTGIEAVISTIYGASVTAEIPLINAAKAIGVQRYVPCFFATVAPPTGALRLRELKEETFNHIKKIKLPYTIIDVGWWYQVNLPRLPSGRIDYAVMETTDGIAVDGNVPVAFTDLRDVGPYTARIISDPRTLNRMVFAYNEVLTFNQMYDIAEKVSGEKLHRKYVPAEEIEARVREWEEKNPAPDSVEFITLSQLQYWYSCCVRGDNTPENAQYLGYLLVKDLYPEFVGTTLETYARDVLEGRGRKVYEHIQDLISIKAAKARQ